MHRRKNPLNIRNGKDTETSLGTQVRYKQRNILMKIAKIHIVTEKNMKKITKEIESLKEEREMLKNQIHNLKEQIKYLNLKNTELTLINQLTI